jgi:hypothetical protein
MNCGSSWNCRCSITPVARCITIMREAARSANGSEAINSGGKKKSKSAVRTRLVCCRAAKQARSFQSKLMPDDGDKRFAEIN